MLHEMAHAAAGRCSVAHGYKFWEQIEGLLAERAPITISCAETPGLQILANAVPRRFPLARKAVERLEARRIRELEELDFDGDEEVIDEEYLIERFDDAATDYLAKRTSVPPDE
ncbi:MAG TPA: hypothetical protein VMU48_19985 [Terracidiphilus sp.]|nr:hypothetical protein [Terracidiphilus sp.]